MTKLIVAFHNVANAPENNAASTPNQAAVAMKSYIEPTDIKSSEK
jgi:hypothetical protein